MLSRYFQLIKTIITIIIITLLMIMIMIIIKTTIAKTTITMIIKITNKVYLNIH